MRRGCAAHGDVLATYVCPLSGGGGPTVLGLRTTALAEAVELDAVVPLAALADRLARPENGSEVPVPPSEVVAAWAGISPPRTGWEQVAEVAALTLVAAAEEGIAEVAAGTPSTSGAPAVAALRGRVWGRPVPGTPLPSGAAFVAHALAFVARDRRARGRVRLRTLDPADQSARPRAGAVAAGRLREPDRGCPTSLPGSPDEDSRARVTSAWSSCASTRCDPAAATTW